jgi:thymidylate kinase
MAKGKLISIDGIGGAGKSTVIKDMVSYLNCHSRNGVKVYKFPNYNSPTGKIIAEFLKGQRGNLADIDQDLIAGMYALDRAAQIRNIEEDLADGVHVILDRSMYSGVVYRWASNVVNKGIGDQNDMWKWLSIEFQHCGFPMPTAIWLNVPGDFAVARMNERAKENGEGADIHEANMELIHTTNLGFQNMVDAGMMYEVQNTKDVAGKTAWRGSTEAANEILTLAGIL